MVNFRIGEVVRLRSGGPAMTVIACGPRSDPGQAQCAWFNSEGAHAVANFPAAALERVEVGPRCVAASPRAA